jgi:PAS domain S-box-containing protein
MNEEPRSGKHRILVVDDNPAIHEDFRKILCASEETSRAYEEAEAAFFGDTLSAPAVSCFDLDSAYQGEEAFEMVKRTDVEGNPYAVAFVDVRMPPGWDGIETIAQVWKVDPHIQIVICTAFSDYAWEDIFKTLGHAERLVILKKPFDTVEVIQLAHSLSEKWTLANQVRQRMEDLDQKVAARTRDLETANKRLTREIAERIQIEAALRHSEERFSKAFAASPLPMAILTHPDERYIDVNDAFLRMMGFSRDEVMQRTSQELKIWHEQSQRTEVLDRLRDTKSVRDFECQFRPKTGPVRTALVSSEVFDLSKSPCMLLIIHDITERTNLESQLRHSQKLEAVGQLASGVAHHFNNILSIVQGYVGLVLEGENVDLGTRESLEQVMSASERAAAFTRQLLTFGRRHVSQYKVLNVNTIIAQLRGMLPALIGEHIRLNCQLSTTPALVYGDASEVEQIVMNMALNSRDAMARGGVLSISTELVNASAFFQSKNPDVPMGKYVLLTVSDTGCGMSEDIQRRVFEPFFTTKDAGKGSGLGLATVYGIVKQHQGWIDLTSAEGHGTTFKIYLPARDADGALSGVKPVPAKMARGNETVLLVEDEPPVRKILCRVLEQYGYHVVEADNGPLALDAWARESSRIDLLLSDAALPGGISGRNLAAQLRKERPNLRVILTSGFNLAETLVPELGATEQDYRFLQKPYVPEKLVSLVRECLDSPLGVSNE